VQQCLLEASVLRLHWGSIMGHPVPQTGERLTVFYEPSRISATAAQSHECAAEITQIRIAEV
jgi:hypothetical protein